MSKANANIKVIYSFRIKNLLLLEGIQPLAEIDNPKKEGYKCQIFENNDIFQRTFDKILKGGKCNG